jgi:hypothetical protein
VRAAVVRAVAPELHVGSLEVAAPAGAAIWIDGLRAATAPAGVLHGLSPGQHLVRVELPGGGESRSYVEVRFDEVTRLSVAATAPPAPEPGGGPLPVIRTGLLVAGGVALVAGFVARGSAGSLRDEHDRAAAPPVADPARARELAASYDARRGLATGLLVGAGVLLAGSGVLFALDLLPGDGAGLALRGAF